MFGCNTHLLKHIKQAILAWSFRQNIILGCYPVFAAISARGEFIVVCYITKLLNYSFWKTQHRTIGLQTSHYSMQPQHRPQELSSSLDLTSEFWCWCQNWGTLRAHDDRNLTRDEGGDEELQDEGEHPEHVPGRPGPLLRAQLQPVLLSPLQRRHKSWIK